jgi:hypothetical protein
MERFVKSSEDCFKSFELIVADQAQFNLAVQTEADTRARIITRILRDALDWPEPNISREEYANPGFMDYVAGGRETVGVPHPCGFSSVRFTWTDGPGCPLTKQKYAEGASGSLSEPGSFESSTHLHRNNLATESQAGYQSARVTYGGFLASRPHSPNPDTQPRNSV